MLFALAVLVCLLALLLMPGATTAAVVQSHSNGKQLARAFSLLTMIILAAGCVGALRIPTGAHHRFRQVYLHGFGPDLLDITCARLC